MAAANAVGPCRPLLPSEVVERVAGASDDVGSGLTPYPLRTRAQRYHEPPLE